MRATMRFCFWLLALLASCGRSATAPQSGGQSTESNGRPNFVFVRLDDLAAEELQYMPQTIALIRDRGANYESAFVSASLCAPSRASILRGQYPHNTRVWGNTFPSGGYLVFREVEGSTLATWLHDGG